MATTYNTVSGDMWDLISYKMYRDEAHIDTLINANPQYRKTAVFKADIKLIIPDRPPPSPVTYLPPWKQRE